MVKKIGEGVFLVMMFLQVSCGNHHDVKIKDSLQKSIESEEELDFTTSLSFLDIYENIIEKNCIDCHMSYESYEVVKKDSSKILEQVLTNRMPQFSQGLSKDLKEVVEEWILAGSPEFGNL